MTWALVIGASAAGQEQAGFSGILHSRKIEVDANGLVRLLGGEASNPERVFAVPSERFLRLHQEQDPAVRVTEEVVRVRNGVARVDVAVSSGNSHVLIYPREGAMYWVRPAERAVVTWRKPATFPGPSPSPPPTLQPLGREATVAGLAAQGYELRRGSERAWVWIATSPAALLELGGLLTDLERVAKPEAEKLDAIVRRAAKKIGFPVRIQVYGPSGYFVHELIRVEKSEQPAEDFQIPKEFHQVSTTELERERSRESP